MAKESRMAGVVRPKVLASTISALLAGTVHAQQDAGNAPIEEVTVTGSRIQRRDLSANSPIMTVDEGRFEESSTIAMESVLNQLPQFVPAVTQFQTVPSGQLSNDGDPATTPSAATVSLRGLGTNRNLVLLDGRRAMPIDASMTVDINGIPSAAVARVETITGGASSVYGADAVAGVVNFVLKDDFQGFDLDVQYGITEEGDAEERSISTLFGANFGDDSNVMIGLERYERGQVLQQDRDFYLEGWEDRASEGGQQVFYTAPYAASDPTNPFDRAVVEEIFGVGPGQIVNTGNFYLNSDGTVYRTQPDGNFRYNGPTRTADGKTYRYVLESSGSLTENWVDQQHSAPLSRHSLFGRARTELTDDISAFGQVMLAESKSEHRERIVGMIGGWGGTVPHGNGIYAPSVVSLGADGLPNTGDPGEDMTTRADYLPGGRFELNCGAVGGCSKSEAWPKSPELRRLLDSRTDPEAPVDVGTATPWFGNQKNTVTTLSYQLLGGLEGNLPFRDWTWEAYISSGVSTTQNELVGTTSTQRWRFVIDQPNYGTGLFQQGNQPGDGFGAGFMECTSGFQFLGSGEEFYHPGTGLSTGGPSQDCLAATGATFALNGRLEQTVSEVNIQGTLATMPAGELAFALGASHRENDFRWFAPPISSPNSIFDVPAGQYPRSETVGSIGATDVYGELLVPLVADKAFARNMSLELGYRHSNNDPTESVESYKALIDWQIVDRVRLRGGHQVANRAPNIAELYQNQVQSLFVRLNGDWCSDLNPVNPLSPNPALNANAAQARALCESLMGPTGASEFYNDPNRPAGALNFVWAFVNGSPAVQHETASTTTLGIVANVTDALTVTADYWSIKIDDMISPQDPDALYRQCLSPVTNPTFDPTYTPCTQLVRDPGDGGQGLSDLLYTNQGAVNFAGWDLALNWSREVGAGLLGVDTTVTLMDKAETRVSPTSPWRDWVGTSGPSDLIGLNGWTYDYRTFVSTNYSVGDWSATLRWRHLPSIKSEGSLSPTSTFQPTNSYDLFDFAGRYTTGGNWAIRFGIDNLFNKTPERTFPETDNPATAPNELNTATGETNENFYDILGRRYYIGFALRM